MSYPGGWKAPRTAPSPDTSAPAPEQPGREVCNDCGARAACDTMKAERDAALDALHRVAQALGLGGVLGRPETIAESAERRAERDSASASWEALCKDALSNIESVVGDDPEHAAECTDLSCCLPSPRAILGLALFARLMAIVTRPSMSAIVTPELVRRYLKATGRHDAGLFETLIQSNDLATVIWGMTLDRAVLGMLAAAELLYARAAKLDSSTSIDGSYKAAVKRREDKREAFSLRNEAERLVEAAGVDPKAWEATR